MDIELAKLKLEALHLYTIGELSLTQSDANRLKTDLARMLIPQFPVTACRDCGISLFPQSIYVSEDMTHPLCWDCYHKRVKPPREKEEATAAASLQCWDCGTDISDQHPFLAEQIDYHFRLLCKECHDKRHMPTKEKPEEWGMVCFDSVNSCFYCSACNTLIKLLPLYPSYHFTWNDQPSVYCCGKRRL